MKRILRGDAPTQAQISRLASTATGLITLGINGKTGVSAASWNATAIAAAWNASKLPEFAEVTATVDGADVLLTSDTPGQPFDVSGLVNGEPTADDEQLVTLSPAGSAITGTFPLTFAGQTAAGISATALPSVVEAALEALSNIGAGNVRVTGEPGAWRVRFVGDLADVDQPELTTSRTSLTGGNAAVAIETLQDGASGAESPLLVVEEVKGVAGTNARWRVRLNADPGVALGAITLRWTYTYPIGTGSGTSASGSFAGDATLDEMRISLGNVFRGPGPDNLSLSGTLANSWVNPTDGILVEWVGAWASTPLDGRWISLQFTGSGAPSQSLLSAAEVNAGVAGTNEVQSLRLTGSTVGTGYRLKLGDRVTREILWSETALAIKTALNDALAGTAASSLSVSLPTGQVNAETLLADYTYDGVILLEFTGNGYQSADVALLEVLGVGAEEIQQVGISSDSWQGQVTLTLGPNTAAALDWDATAAEMDAALEALANVGAGKVTCYGGPWPSAPIVAQFDASLGNLPQMTAAHTLTNAGIAVSTLQQGGAAVVVTEIQRSRGPLHWDDPLNWADDNGLPGVPGAGDTVTLDSAVTDLLYGLRQRCEFTVDPTTDRLTLATGRQTFWEGQSLRVRSADTLPGGLSADTTYYAVNVTGASLQLALTADGDAINITSAGTGLHEIGVRLPALYIDSTFAKSLGLPRTNARGYDEYRPQALELWADVIEVGNGQGSGSNRTKLDTGAVATALEVIQTGGSIEAGVPALLWQGNHANNLLENIAGDVGVGFYAEDSAQLALLVQRGGNTVLGRDVDVAKVKRTGGTFASLGATINGEVVL